jgi:hypothetical protein
MEDRASIHLFLEKRIEGRESELLQKVRKYVNTRDFANEVLWASLFCFTLYNFVHFYLRLFVKLK